MKIGALFLTFCCIGTVSAMIAAIATLPQGYVIPTAIGCWLIFSSIGTLVATATLFCLLFQE